MEPVEAFGPGAGGFEGGETGWYDGLWEVAGPAYAGAQAAAFPVSEYAGQQGFMPASEILALASAAGATGLSAVLDCCCGPGAAALMIAEHFGCRVFGIDKSGAAIRRAQSLAAGRRLQTATCFSVADALHLPFGAFSFDIVLLLETLLAFEGKGALFGEMARVLETGGRFAFSAEVGRPLTAAERSLLPGGDVYLSTGEEVRRLLEGAGLHLLMEEDCTAAHARVARRFAQALAGRREALRAEIGQSYWEHLHASAARWAEWLKGGRVHKLLVLAEKR